MQIAFEILPENFPLILKMSDLEKDILWNMYRSAVDNDEEMYIVLDDAPDAKYPTLQMERKMLYRSYKTKMTTVYNLTERNTP